MADLKYAWRAIRPKAVCGLAYWLVRFIGGTMRMEFVGAPDDFSSKIICGWHGRSFAFANSFRGRGFWVIISHSNDGELQTRIFSRLGFKVIRGSTGRGGVRALVEAIRALKAGGTMAMTPDGPRGPSGVVQDGVIAMAQKSGAALIPAAFSCTPRRVFSSWDRYTLPYPFGRGVIVFGAPMLVPADATEDELETLRQELQEEIHRLELDAEIRMGYQEGERVLAADSKPPL